MIINNISTFVKRAAFTAVILLRPLKYNAGAITEPKIAVRNRIKYSFLDMKFSTLLFWFMVFNILFLSGEKLTKNRNTLAIKYVSAARAKG